MKVPASLRRLYEDQKTTNERLKEIVDTRMHQLREPRWHYESRVKELVSYALKVESGRVASPEALEDYFACTMVVATSADITRAEERIRHIFSVKERRPPEAGYTRKASDRFVFDDLRLYAALRDDPFEVQEDLIGIVFEVQIKTFLQHAWSIATHDLVYKTDDASWSKERIAYQIKAMLEHAEVSIEEADRLSASRGLAKRERRTEVVKKGIELVKEQWDADELPRDLRRMASNIVGILKALGMTVGQLGKVLDDGRAARGGHHPANLSPYGTVVQYLLSAERNRMVSLLKRPRLRTKVLIPKEIELPEDVDVGEMRNAVFVVDATP